VKEEKAKEPKISEEEAEIKEPAKDEIKSASKVEPEKEEIKKDSEELQVEEDSKDLELLNDVEKEISKEKSQIKEALSKLGGPTIVEPKTDEILKDLEESQLTKESEKEKVEKPVVSKADLEKKIAQLQKAKTKKEIDKAEEHIIESVQKEIKDTIDSGANRQEVKDVVGSMKDFMSNLSKSVVDNQSNVINQMTKALGAITQKIEENSKKLETFAEAEDKKISMLADQLVSDKSKRHKIRKEEVEQYLGHLKKKKTDDGEERVSFD